MNGLKCLPAEKSADRCKCCPYGYHIDVDFLNIISNSGQRIPLNNKLVSPSSSGTSVVSSSSSSSTSSSLTHPSSNQQKLISSKHDDVGDCSRLIVKKEILSQSKPESNSEDLNASIQNILNCLKLLQTMERSFETASDGAANLQSANKFHRQKQLLRQSPSLNQQQQINSRTLHRQNLTEQFGLKASNSDPFRKNPLRKALTCHDIISNDHHQRSVSDETLLSSAEIMKISFQLKNVLNYLNKLQHQTTNIPASSYRLSTLLAEREILRDKLCEKCKPLLDENIFDNKDNSNANRRDASNDKHSSHLNEKFSLNEMCNYRANEIVRKSSFIATKQSFNNYTNASCSQANITQGNCSLLPKISSRITPHRDHTSKENVTKSDSPSSFSFKSNSNFIKLTKLHRVLPKPVSLITRPQSASENFKKPNDLPGMKPDISLNESQTGTKSNKQSTKLFYTKEPVSHASDSLTPGCKDQTHSQIYKISLSEASQLPNRIPRRTVGFTRHGSLKCGVANGKSFEIKNKNGQSSPKPGVQLSFSSNSKEESGDCGRSYLRKCSLEASSSSDDEADNKDDFPVVNGRKQLRKTSRRSLSLIVPFTSPPVPRCNISASAEEDDLMIGWNTDQTDDQSSTSFDEGAYDGELGQIIYKQKTADYTDV